MEDQYLVCCHVDALKIWSLKVDDADLGVQCSDRGVCEYERRYPGFGEENESHYQYDGCW